MLTAAEIKQYNEDGYVIPKAFTLTKTEVANLQSALEFVLEHNPNILPDRLMNPHLNRGKLYGVMGHQNFCNLVHDQRIINMAADVMGQNLILLFSHLFCKKSKSSRVVPWHQDGPFWPVKPMKSCTI